MTIGVVTAGFYGQKRDFTAFGVERWIEAESAWKRIADLDSPGLFVFSDGQRWELRISGLDAKRRDGFKRPIRNSLVVQGKAGHDAELAAAAARCGASPDGFAELEDAIAEVLTPDRVEELFAGTATTADLAEPVYQIAARLPAYEPTDRPGSWSVGQHTPGAVSAVLQRATRLADGGVGLIAYGVTYPEPEDTGPGDLLIVQAESSQGWKAILQPPPSQALVAPEDGHPKVIPPAILILAGLAILTVVLVVLLI